MKENKSGSFWPYGIIIGMGLFITFIGYIVYRVTSVDVHLVQKNYYQEEIKYQDKIESLKRASKGDISLEYYQSKNLLKIIFDSAYYNQDLQGTVNFYRPSNANLDFDVALKVNEGMQVLNTGKMEPGLWKVKVDFMIDGHSYFKELSFFK